MNVGRLLRWLPVLLAITATHVHAEDKLPRRAVEGQPLASHVRRLMESLETLGVPVPKDTRDQIQKAIDAESSADLQTLVDPLCLCALEINPELRVRAHRGAGDPVLQQGGYTPVLIKVANDATLARKLRVSSPQAGPVYAGAAEAILLRQAQTELRDNENINRERRFLDLEVYSQPPMTGTLSGLAVEYVIVLIHCSESGTREATLTFDVGEGTQDLGFRSDLPVLFSVRPAIPVRLDVRDFDGTPTTARLEFRDSQGHVYPPQAKRLAPDFFFQPQVYRRDGQVVLLPPGDFRMESSRGPEYVPEVRPIHVTDAADQSIEVRLKRWINPARYGFYSGDHHIHAAGCSHYDNPTQGVTPSDMMTQVQGEGLNVGCVLTWGPCFDHQRTFFAPQADVISEPLTVLKYDLEISGFGSAALGHVCLLNLKDQTYPGSGGTSTEGWPTWTVPVMRWAKDQEGVTGYPHSALHAGVDQHVEWIFQHYDEDHDEALSRQECVSALLPEPFPSMQTDQDDRLSKEELRRAADRQADSLPNLTLPAMDGGGAMEIFVSTSEGVCDFISAMDTARIPEWNTWYHLMNCGFPLKLSGETDFPCMSSRRVGQGRVYVQLGPQQQIRFQDWTEGVAAGRSYVSDGYAHAVSFAVNGQAPGHGQVSLAGPDRLTVSTTVAMAPELPAAVAYGTLEAPRGRRMAGDTVNLHAPRDSGTVKGGDRLFEVIVNGQVAASQSVPADGQPHDLRFEVPIERSSWVAIRQFPQLHTNPVEVRVAGQPIRASRASALWCAESVRLLWKNRHRFIAEAERGEARAAYERALATYLRIASECPGDDLQVDQRPLAE